MTDQAIEGQTALFDNVQLDSLASVTRTVRPVPEAKDPLVGLREFHGWTLNKLEVFENYLKMYRQVAGGGLTLALEGPNIDCKLKNRKLSAILVIWTCKI
jgi:hypothetical protein